jgi:anhydro-N-acetylmuramic acid kinase
MMNRYHVIGIMSGTSLDGVDLAECIFEIQNERWIYSIINAETVSYSDNWKKRLSNASELNAFDFVLLQKEYGGLLSEFISGFILKYNATPDFISSHGHTVFHKPDLGITCQIGDGAVMAARLNMQVVCDFRSVDVALNGQGAPLVPIGDELLFSEYFFRLNLGGIANISYKENGKTIAFDICPFNMALNYLAEQLGCDFDESGIFASKGVINHELLVHLSELDFFKSLPPKSLGREWFDAFFQPILDSYSISVNDKLRTVAELIAVQIGKATETAQKQKILVTGGGTFNKFVLSLIQKKSKNKIITTDPKIINFKEALIFGFLGVLRMRGQYNCLSSVTGALRDSVGGCIYHG